MSDLDALQSSLGYQFETTDLLWQALTHRSFGNEHGSPDLERLEFLGDAVLQMSTTLLLVDAFPKAREGELSRLRARLVNTRSLAVIAREHEVGVNLRLGRGEDDTGGRNRDSNLADATEAILGAVYRDGGFSSAKALVARWMQPLISRIEASGTRRMKDPKSRLQELSQAGGGPTPRYLVARREGPSHEPVFHVEVHVGKQIWGRGMGPSKRDAEVAAAVKALRIREGDA